MTPTSELCQHCPRVISMHDENPILSLAHLTFLKTSPPELVDLAARSGFDAVGLRFGAARPGDDIFPMVGDSPLRRETRKRMRANGIRLLDVEVLCLYPDTTADSFRPLIDASAELEATFLLVNVEDTNRERVGETLERLCELAAPGNLSLGLEWMIYRQLKHLSEAMDIIGQVSAKNICLVVDSLHFFRSGTSVSELAHVPREKIGYIQLSDGCVPAPELEQLSFEARFDRKLPGEGQLPLSELIAALPSNIAVSMEIPSVSADMSSLERAMRVGSAGREILGR